jgi:hypothetical protein
MSIVSLGMIAATARSSAREVSTGCHEGDARPHCAQDVMRINPPAYLSTDRVAHSYRFRGKLLFLTYFPYFEKIKIDSAPSPH